MPLQAADLFAWQVRRFYADKLSGKQELTTAMQELSRLDWAPWEWPEENLKTMIGELKSSGSVFEHDIKSPKLRKKLNQILKKRFSDEGKDA